MSAYTSAECYRAGGYPPVIKAADLTTFVERVQVLGILQSETMDIMLKFGQAIDQDDRSAWEMVQVTECISMLADFAWDIEERQLSGMQAQELLRTLPDTENIYRVHLSFGMLRDDIRAQLSRVEDEQNFLELDHLSFTINPILLNDPQEDDIFHVGWLSFSVSGYGCLLSGEYEEMIAKLRASDALHALRNICREMWPATDVFISEDIEVRMQMGKLWAEAPDAPFDWYWAINETY